ncbi:RluA family pseudouridine synthase, partial [Candidatus Microgenomates bacterium]|nr:RluA family pseudouridine synthase [Candidatus Microgenomates bacterium]
MEPRILYEDKYLLVVDKPAGMVVNRAESVKGETVEDWLASNFQFSIFNFQLMRHGVVHRIDKETSGVLLVAKTPEVFENLQAQFKERGVQKSYVALVHGKVMPEEGVINVPIGRLPWN